MARRGNSLSLYNSGEVESPTDLLSELQELSYPPLGLHPTHYPHPSMAARAESRPPRTCCDPSSQMSDCDWAAVHRKVFFYCLDCCLHASQSFILTTYSISAIIECYGGAERFSAKT
jgi:hypothetical protein